MDRNQRAQRREIGLRTAGRGPVWWALRHPAVLAMSIWYLAGPAVGVVAAVAATLYIGYLWRLRQIVTRLLRLPAPPADHPSQP